MKSIRVLIAESCPVSQEGMGTILQTAPDLKIVGKTTHSQEIIPLAQKHQPDILLLDLKMPETQPAELVERLCQRCPQMKVLALSDDWDGTSVHDLVAAGVSGYIDRAEIPENIVNAIGAVDEGGIWFSPAALEQLMEQENEPALAKEFDLTDREVAVLRLLAAGKTNREIALTLEVSVKTVEKCLTAIYEKLGEGSRVLAAVWAERNGLT